MLTTKDASPDLLARDNDGEFVRRTLLVCLIFVGFAARVWHLGTQSLWLDEALSVIFSRPSLGDVIQTLMTEDLHPPLYYVVLHFWMRAAGSTEFAARFVSLFFGLPAIPATYALGSALFRDPRLLTTSNRRGQGIGLIAAAMVSVSPFLVYYSQEARMYSALATFGILSSLSLWNLLSVPSRRWWIAYVLCTAATLYTQYFGGLILGFEAVYLLGIAIRHRQRAILGFSGLAATGVLFVPWIPGAILQIRRLITIPDFWKGEFHLSFLLTHVFAAFAVGQFVALNQYAAVAALVGFLVVGGLAILTWRALRRGGGEIFVLTYLIVPMVVLYAVVARNPKFAERYLIMIAPPFYLVIALGLFSAATWLSGIRRSIVRRVSLTVLGALGVALVVASASQVWQIYYGPTYSKDDNRGAIAYIERNAQPGDVVVLMIDGYQSYEYYSRGDIPWEPLQPGGDADAAARRMNEIAAGHRRMWLYLWNPEWGDPSGFVRDSLDRAYRQERVTQPFTGIGLRLYDIDPTYRFQAKTIPSVAKPVNFGNKVRLLGYDLDQATVQSGKNGRITLYWEAQTALDADYIVSLRLKGSQFYWWRHDDRPAAFNFPTMYWQPGKVVTGDIEFQIPPGTPPGAYDLEVGVYAQGQGPDLNVLNEVGVATGTAVSIARIAVSHPENPPTVQSLGIPSPLDVPFGSDLRLLGASVGTATAARGAPVEVTLWWRATQAPLSDYRVRLTLQNGVFQRVVSDDVPDSGGYGTSRWANGEIVVDRHRVTIPPDAQAGPTRIDLEIWKSGATSPVQLDRGAVFTIGTVNVLDRQRLTAEPSGIQTRTDWSVGSFARLIGSTVNSTSVRPGDHVALTLYWKATGSSGNVPYTVFAHLLDSQQQVKAQQDRAPGDGTSPTTGWTDGEYIVDHYDLTLASDAAPGTYDLEVGMYDSTGGTRAPVVDQVTQATGDRIVIAKIVVR